MKLFNFKNTHHSFGIGEAYITAYMSVYMHCFLSYFQINLPFNNVLTYMGICAMICNKIGYNYEII